jgi:hypothetical protein
MGNKLSYKVFLTCMYMLKFIQKQNAIFFQVLNVREYGDANVLFRSVCDKLLKGVPVLRLITGSELSDLFKLRQLHMPWCFNYWN